MKLIKNYTKFINESSEPEIVVKPKLKEIIEGCEEILLYLNDEGFTSKLYCHDLGLTDPKYLGQAKGKSKIFGYTKDDSILFYLNSTKEFQYSDIEDTIERLKSYLSPFGYQIEFIPSKGEPEIQKTIEYYSAPNDEPSMTTPGLSLVRQLRAIPASLLAAGDLPVQVRITTKDNWILIFRFVQI